ncbi:IclR family transcriptional regulator [Rhodococcus antarcticus]|jgi:IclR family acetate operon transcriptional repressor|uniref:IclR family transcriptional regulator n=1 Tax=Rhodococcus antarcticus TaxID=2987751 RepID=A0ABY6P2J1_9NOCA|nr:IclR family transcriptional regulator [Rhodococcus antarcticus]UZJ25855.1 IclR family transcriptional regulator [Rhodococcus antarcticus]
MEVARGQSGVQSVDRAFTLLELLADAGGRATLGELAAASGLPAPTIHRLLRTLVAGGHLRQEPSRAYALGPRLVRLGEGAGRLLGSWVHPALTELVEVTGETANMAVLEGDRVVYLAQVPSKHAMRMFTEVGRRVPVHCTAVGKALVAQLSEADVRAIVARAGMPAQTPNTLTEPAALLAHLEQVRRQGFATDEAEQELGVRCVAVPVLDGPARVALSVSGPDARFTPAARDRVVPEMQRVATELARISRA